MTSSLENEYSQTPYPTRRQREKDVATALVNFGLEGRIDATSRSSAYYATVISNISTYSDCTLNRLMEAAHSPYASNVLNRIVYGEATEDAINDRYMLAPVIDSLRITAVSVPYYLDALDHYEGLAPQHKGSYPAKRVEQASAIIRVTHYLHQNRFITTYYPEDSLLAINMIPDETLSALILASDNPAAVADLIISREMFSGDEVAELMDSLGQLTPSLKNGAL